MSQAARVVSRTKSVASRQQVMKTSTSGTSSPHRRSFGRLRGFMMKMIMNECSRVGMTTDSSTAMNTQANG
jgi:hypothetical protein